VSFVHIGLSGNEVSTMAGMANEDRLSGLMKSGIGENNPVLVQILGICSALAVTGLVSTTLVMGLSLMLVTSLSCLFISLLRNTIPHRVRLMVQMLVISVFVILIHLYLKAFHYDISRALGAYVGLIITNCIVLGRSEGYALRHGPIASFIDGLANAFGYALVLLCISLVREGFGGGTLLGWKWSPAGFRPALILKSAPGAFVTLGCLVWIVRGWALRKSSAQGATKA
jgi:Na+-transporting NADH:ubiquinone oxidoreductase subunit D